MKNLLLVLSVFLAASAVADDSWLYWMVGDTGSYTLGTDYDTVRVRDTTGTLGTDGYLSLYYDSSTEIPSAYGGPMAVNNVNEDIALMDYGVGLYAQLAADPSSSSFVIELWNDSSFVAQSTAISYETARAYIQSGNSMSFANPWVGTGYAIPEPNSGLLMLIGCAMLGLRRRRQRKV